MICVADDETLVRHHARCVFNDAVFFIDDGRSVFDDVSCVIGDALFVIDDASFMINDVNYDIEDVICVNLSQKHGFEAFGSPPAFFSFVEAVNMYGTEAAVSTSAMPSS